MEFDLERASMEDLDNFKKLLTKEIEKRNKIKAITMPQLIDNICWDMLENKIKAIDNEVKRVLITGDVHHPEDILWGDDSEGLTKQVFDVVLDCAFGSSDLFYEWIENLIFYE